MSAALNNPMQFAFPQTQEQLQQTIQAQVYAALDQMQQQQLANEQAMQAAKPVNHTPSFQKALDAETRLINETIQKNLTLKEAFGKFDLDAAINGDGGPALQQLAHRIDNAVVKVAGFGGEKDTPLTDQGAVTKAVHEGSRHYANLDMTSVEDGSKFASGVAGAAADSSVGGDDPSDFDYEREGPQPDFQTPDDKVVAEHFKGVTERHGLTHAEAEPTIAEQAPATGKEPAGFYDA